VVSKSLALLLRDAHATVDAGVQAALADAGFTEIHPGHLIVLRNLGEDGARPSELALSAGVTRQAITKAVDDLERVGLVRREPASADGRGVVVRYTRRGLAGLTVARQRMAELEREFAEAVGERRWATARRVLEQLFA
jgi:DNA-binding MarR family transcriptional regulator